MGWKGWVCFKESAQMRGTKHFPLTTFYNVLLHFFFNSFPPASLTFGTGAWLVDKCLAESGMVQEGLEFSSQSPHALILYIIGRSSKYGRRQSQVTG